VLIVGVRGLETYFESDVVTFVKDVESLERVAETPSVNDLSTGEKRMIHYFALTTGYSAAFAESVVT
jgi:hypothetical protein